ncbi:triacylglycerol lipase [Anopheles darlingi]|uniref:Triacylglycerol lipase n=1 Tax=Anopheles darlingi TaxID=43151 RepID=W5JRP1_ANODA|nr:triacylglycerol lipase [Anopheles darlingi]
MRSRGLSWVSKTLLGVVAIVGLLAGSGPADGQLVGAGPRARPLVNRIRERRLERIRLRQERFAATTTTTTTQEYAFDDYGPGPRTDDYGMDVEDEVIVERGPTSEPLLIATKPNRRRSQFEERILLRFYHGGNLTKTTTLNDDERLLNDTNCTADERFALVVHGWRENCYEVPWVKELRNNLQKFRGGCIACMDYSAYSSGGYGGLVARFRDIRDILLRTVQQLRYEGVEYGRMFLFGFSFGAQLVLDVGNRIGSNELEAIDTCDMAGPGFDSDRMFKQTDFRAAAKNVQCIHTSIDKGTKFPNKCHQNWRMGQCGLRQAAAGPPPLGSHGLCPVFYNLAFEQQFLAQPKAPECLALGEVATYPRNYRMGYMENRKSEVRGELFAATSDVYPYAVYTNPYNFFEYF